MNFRSTSRRRPELLLDLTPLIDVVFLLLIFFLITTTFVKRQETVVTINLPDGQGEVTNIEDERLTVFLQATGDYTIQIGAEDSYQVDANALEAELRTFYETNPDLAIFLRGDRDVDYGSVIDLLLTTREIGFQKVQAVIRRQGSEPGIPGTD